MSTRKSAPKRQSGKKPAATARKRGAAKPTITPQIQLSQNLQREIFAVILVFLGLLTLLFSTFSGDQGVIGTQWNTAVARAFGTGKVLVPVALGILGGLMIFQERFSDNRLSGANILGTLMVLLSLLMLLEYPGYEIHREHPEFHVGAGGGVVGQTLLTILISGIGKGGALLFSVTVGLIGIMLTFNLTLRQIMAALLYYTGGLRILGRRLVGAPVQRAPMFDDYPEEHYRPLELPAPQAMPKVSNKRRQAIIEDTTSQEVMLTPIAERPAQASLFNRDLPDPSRPPRRKEVAPPPVVPTTMAPTKRLKPANTDEAKPNQANASAEEAAFIEPDEALTHRAWPLPTLPTLDDFVEGQIGDEEKREKARIIEETLASFRVEARVVEANTGPAVTQFALQPAIGVKINKITSLQNDLALALAAPSLRIEAPVPGRSVVGIEIPNSAIATVAMRDVIGSEDFDVKRGKLKIPLGKDVSGNVVIADLAKMPHLLVAGSTGSGKSICINSIIISLLMKHTPNELKFIMVDPKMVELIVYNNIPHLLTPVVTELERVVSSLKWAVREMERRYKVFAKGGFRNLESYMQAARKRPDLEPMPYIVVIIDELADLMMLAPDEVETLICRLAQMARATGIHLILATQRPSVDVVTGLIKANFPTRIAFAVTSQIDSRVILDTPGAEQLLGRGDMLYLAVDAAKAIRVQGTFVSDGEVERVVQFWRLQIPPELAQANGANAGNATNAQAAPAANSQTSMGDVFLQADEQDELLPKAIELVRQHQRASASMLQRRLRIGYSKAAQLIELLEQRGIVGPAEGSRSREVLNPNQGAQASDE
ncbi:DNA translocase FtsK [Herpetosiphon giganteus]|uniref:DNA translocase FtsK n=1 Tax=Herpetosiphon giganteus TaxID=2029754 RepID=UPI00195B5410|nr:DNA translocase FtsK [Herpetosiphon giganteus]MBM7844073.1 S-DNA-T family DNA segregation ATPase FtsK/SpoIIIE [Herpetosiphon giganteus]